MNADFQQDQEQNAHIQHCLEALDRVSHGTTTHDDAKFLASELGLTTQYKQENGNAS